MPKRVLVAEDEPNIAESLTFLLRQAGFEVSVVGDGAEALNEARSTVPDVVLLDVMLPTMDGYEVLRRLRGDAQTIRLPVIVLTAKGQHEDRAAALDHGADLFITKPFSNADVVAAVKRLSNDGSGA